MLDKVRIDKWLWAARFYKTRSLAKKAIEGGKVRIDGQRPKVSKEIELGQKLSLRQGYDDKEVVVMRLSDQRGPASIAITLYEETPESIALGEKNALERKTNAGTGIHTEGKPNTRQRRHIHRFKREI